MGGRIGRVGWLGMAIGLAMLLIGVLAVGVGAETAVSQPVHAEAREIVVTETVSVVDLGGRAGDALAMMEVGGRPALAFYDETRGSVQFMRAADRVGSVWQSPVEVYVGGYVEHLTLASVNGRPALVFGDFSAERVVFVLARDASGTSWQAAVTVDGAVTGGGWYDLAMVNGRPAIAYAARPTSGNGNELRYVRATDASGTSWGTPQTVDNSSLFVGLYSRLAIVDGNPAIAYQNNTLADLMFVRADDVNGTSWGTPQPLATFGAAGNALALGIVGGNPTVVHHNASFNRVEVVQATSADGSVWGAPVTVTIATQIYEPLGLEMINGRPSIAFQSDETLSFVRANDASGGSWPAPTLIYAEPNPAERPSHVSLTLIDGKPSVAAYSEDRLSILFGQANDNNGVAWPELAAIYGGSVGARNDLLQLNGRLGMSYHDNASEALYFVRSADDAGLMWEAPVLVDEEATIAEREHDLLLVDGRPAIVYGNERKTELRYVRAANAAGSSWLSPTVVVTGRIDTVGGGVINGRPVAAFFESGQDVLQFVRANDADGLSWSTPVTVSASSYAGQNLAIFSLEGYPAVIHWGQRNLLLSRATSPAATSWMSPTTIVTNASGAGYSVDFQEERLSVALYVSDGINGRGGRGNSPRLVYVRAMDAEAEMWGEPVTVLENELADNRPFLFMLHGRPAIVYNGYDSQSDENRWYLIRAQDAAGSVWDVPDLLFATDGEPDASLLPLDALRFGLSYGEDVQTFFSFDITLRYEQYLPMIQQ